MDTPLTSVIMPVFNGALYLRAAIESVLAQDHTRFELIIVNDGSSDGSEAIIAEFPTALAIHQGNQGVAAARNAGIARAAGSLLAFLDQDDTWTPDKLRLQSGYLEMHPELDFVLAMQRLSLAPGCSAPGWLRPEHLDAPQIGFLPGTLLARRSAFERVGGFDPQYRYGSDDADWFARAKDAGLRHAVMPEVLLNRLIHDGNRSAQVREGNRELLRIMRASIARRRGPATGDTS